MLAALTVASWTELFSRHADLERGSRRQVRVHKISVSKNHCLQAETGSVNSVSVPFHSVGTPTIDRREPARKPDLFLEIRIAKYSYRA